MPKCRPANARGNDRIRSRNLDPILSIIAAAAAAAAATATCPALLAASFLSELCETQMDLHDFAIVCVSIRGGPAAYSRGALSSILPRARRRRAPLLPSRSRSPLPAALSQYAADIADYSQGSMGPCRSLARRSRVREFVARATVLHLRIIMLQRRP